MSDSRFLGSFKKPFFIGSLIRKIQKIPDSMLYEPIVDPANEFCVEYDFDIRGWRFTIEREYSDCRLYAKHPNCPEPIVELVRRQFLKRK